MIGAAAKGGGVRRRQMLALSSHLSCPSSFPPTFCEIKKKWAKFLWNHEKMDIFLYERSGQNRKLFKGLAPWSGQNQQSENQGLFERHAAPPPLKKCLAPTISPPPKKKKLCWRRPSCHPLAPPPEVDRPLEGYIDQKQFAGVRLNWYKIWCCSRGHSGKGYPNTRISQYQIILFFQKKGSIIWWCAPLASTNKSGLVGLAKKFVF